MHISRKAFTVALGASTALTLAVSGWIMHAPVWLVTVAAGVLAAGTVAVTSRVVHGSPTFASIRLQARASIVRWIAAASAVHVAWVFGFEIRPDLWLEWVAGLGAFGALEYGVAHGQQYLMTALVPLPARAERVRRDQAQVSTDPSEVFAAALDRAGYGYATVVEWSEFGPGVQFVVRIPSRMALVSDDKKSAVKKLADTGESAEAIAIGLSEVLGTPMMTDWVHVTKMREAGHYTVTVVTQDVLARVIAYVDDPTPASITEPVTIGKSIDGTPARLNLAQHGQVIGKSRSGKSSLIHVGLAHVTRCVDAEVWICGTEKLYDLVASWLHPYEGTDLKPPIDWIAYGLGDVLEMLVAAMRVARHRQRVPLSKRQNWKKIIVVLDEASFALGNRSQKIGYDRVLRTAAELAAMVTKGAGSAGVHLILASQRGTNDEFGDQGGHVKANMGWSAVFQTQDPSELGRILGDWKLPTPRHKGAYWANLGEGTPLQLKAPYIQENDPARPRLHDGATLADISWARRDLVKNEPLDAGSREAAGAAYANRHRRADALIAYLTGETPQPAGAGTSERELGYQKAKAELDALFGATPALEAAAPNPAPITDQEAMTATAVLDPPATRKDRIVQIVSSAGQATTGQILDALREDAGGEINETSVMNTLRGLVTDGVLTRPDKGRYIPA